jgi:hypothetical protein
MPPLRIAVESRQVARAGRPGSTFGEFDQRGYNAPRRRKEGTMTADEALTKITVAPAWFEAMAQAKRTMGAAEFQKWIESRAKRWSVRKKIIGMMAWNDHNSEYFLQIDRIMKLGRDRDGNTITAEDVALNLSSML